MGKLNYLKTETNRKKIAIKSVKNLHFRAQVLRPIHTVNTTVGSEDWIRINFTSTLSEWIVNRRSNNLLYISIEYENEYGQRDVPSVDANYLLSYWDSDHQPFITAYFRNTDSEDHVVSSNIKVIKLDCLSKFHSHFQIFTIRFLIFSASPRKT